VRKPTDRSATKRTREQKGNSSEAPRGRATADGDGDGAAQRPRSFWSGSVTFGLVSLPVDLYPATRSERAELRMLDADGTPLARRYYCAEDNEEVPEEHLVRGSEVDGGRFVVVTDAELEALEPKKSREIDLRLFVNRSTLDPIYFDRAYFLLPGKGANKAYTLLASVMESTGRAGIATFVLRDREYLIAILSEQGLLHGQTLRFHESVRTAKNVLGSVDTKASPLQIKRYESALKSLAAKALPVKDMADEHADRIRQLAEKKLHRNENVVHSDATVQAESEGGELIDLMAALKHSLTGSKRNPSPKKTSGGTVTPMRKSMKGSPSRRTPVAARRARGPG
jgi:DNA end-binding protein Ku